MFRRNAGALFFSGIAYYAAYWFKDLPGANRAFTYDCFARGWTAAFCAPPPVVIPIWLEER